jgi:hypothetical protein
MAYNGKAHQGYRNVLQALYANQLLDPQVLLDCFTPCLFIKIGFKMNKCGASGMAAIMIVCRGTTFTIQWDQELWLAVIP